MFDQQPFDLKIVVAVDILLAQNFVEISLGFSAANICRQGQDVAQGGRTLTAFLIQILDKTAIGRGDAETVDLLRRTLTVTQIAVGSIGSFWRLFRGDVQNRLVGHVNVFTHRGIAEGMPGAFLALLEQSQKRNVFVRGDTQGFQMPDQCASGDIGKPRATDRGVDVGEIAL